MPTKGDGFCAVHALQGSVSMGGELVSDVQRSDLRGILGNDWSLLKASLSPQSAGIVEAYEVPQIFCLSLVLNSSSGQISFNVSTIVDRPSFPRVNDLM